VIGDMLGVLPEERGMLLKWSDDMMTGLSSHIDPASAEIQAVMDAFTGYTEFTMDLITKRRAEPTDDLFSMARRAEPGIWSSR
jgi:cholest-4-en-3-one 26-monooxygenase